MNGGINIEVIHRILGIDEVFKAPNRMMEILLDKSKREKVFEEFLEYETNLNYEWFSRYFEEEQADRKTNKQDFTPIAVSKLLTRIMNGNTYFETAAGTGNILIQAWDAHKKNISPLDYRPSDYWYHTEELSDRALPFLLFNYLIRGMNGVVVHGDAINREIKNIYFIQNSKDDHLSFSELNVMPRTKMVEHEFKVKSWKGQPIEHIESELIKIVEQG